MCLRGSAEYADVTCFEIRGRLRCAGVCLFNCIDRVAVLTCCIDRLDAPSSDLHRLDPLAVDFGVLKMR